MDAKSNEIPAVPKLLERIALSGTVVTHGCHALAGRNRSGHR